MSSVRNYVTDRLSSPIGRTISRRSFSLKPSSASEASHWPTNAEMASSVEHLAGKGPAYPTSPAQYCWQGAEGCGCVVNPSFGSVAKCTFALAPKFTGEIVPAIKSLPTLKMGQLGYGLAYGVISYSSYYFGIVLGRGTFGGYDVDWPMEATQDPTKKVFKSPV